MHRLSRPHRLIRRSPDGDGGCRSRCIELTYAKDLDFHPNSSSSTLREAHDVRLVLEHLSISKGGTTNHEARQTYPNRMLSLYHVKKKHESSQENAFVTIFEPSLFVTLLVLLL